MARTAVLGRLTWQLGEVVELVEETTTVSSLVMTVPDWTGHQPGQHVDLRLTAEDGYRTQRSYSIASAPEQGRLAVTVERLDDGEVSPYLVGVVIVGDKVEFRGPIGGYFVWDETATAQPLLLVGGGSGVVPLMSMIRHRAAVNSKIPTRLLYSSRSVDDVIYRKELDQLGRGDGLSVHLTLTRTQPPGWTGFARRIDREMLQEVAWPMIDSPLAFVCGPTSFVESAAEILVSLGYDPRSVKTERFGATGG
ncbi:MAG TPA: ferredoxin reductase [Candidatus Dormibacteraeota bacterium]|nr:ferredoxin reductase [Candidatus Dormibacteraeota bacterium]